MTVTISGSGTVTGVTSAAGLISAGTVAYFAATSTPTGWLAADGSAVSRTTYSALFAAIGTTFGTGDGSTTFNLPNLGGQFIRSWESGQTTDSGRVFGSSQADELKSHTHEYTLPNLRYQNFASPGGGNPYFGEQAANTLATGGTETRPVNVALLACIKY